MPAAQPRWWGWHRLADARAAALVRDARVPAGALVLDLGAGDGALTAPLVRAGARVVAFELDPGRAHTLRQRFSGDGVRVVQADVADLRLPRQPFRVVANPPFAVAVAVLRRLTGPGSRLVRADVVVPAHLARRWAAGYAPGAGRWTSTFEVSAGPRIPPRAFLPPGPPAAVLVIERRSGPAP